EDPESVLRPAPENPEDARQDLIRRNLILLGSAGQMIEWSDKRVDEMAAVLMKLLDDKSPVMRRWAANVIGAAVVKVDPPDLTKQGESIFWKLLHYIEPERMLDKPDRGSQPEERPQKSNLAVQLEKRKVEERLRRLRDDDPDQTVRTAARNALSKSAEIK